MFEYGKGIRPDTYGLGRRILRAIRHAALSFLHIMSAPRVAEKYRSYVYTDVAKLSTALRVETAEL